MVFSTFNASNALDCPSCSEICFHTSSFSLFKVHSSLFFQSSAIVLLPLYLEWSGTIKLGTLLPCWGADNDMLMLPRCSSFRSIFVECLQYILLAPALLVAYSVKPELDDAVRSRQFHYRSVVCLNCNLCTKIVVLPETWQYCMRRKPMRS